MCIQAYNAPPFYRQVHVMATLFRSTLVDYTDQQMFDLINDIEAYPQFLAGCLGAKVLSKNGQIVEAQLVLGKGALQQTLTTRNELSPPHSMLMKLVSGPFKVFQGYWQFQMMEDGANCGCKVSLMLEFEFSNPLLAMAANKWMENLASQQVDSLCERAKRIYGQGV